MVHLEVHVEGFGEVRGLHERRDAALHRDVAAEIVRRLCGEPRREGGEAARRVLRREDRDRQLLLQLDVVVDVIVGQRVLVPVEPQPLGRLPDPQRVRIDVRPGRVEHDREAVTHRAAHGFTNIDVDLRVRRRMDLVRGPSFGLEHRGFLGVRLLRGEHGRARVRGHAVAIRPEQLVDRQLRDLAGDVPERDVHRADRPVGRRAVALPEPLIESLAVERVLAHHDGLEELDQRLAVQVGAALRGAEERVPLDAVVGFDGQQAELALAAEPAGVPAVGGRRNIGPGEEGQRDVGDLHEGLPPFISISEPPGRVSVVIAPSGAARAHRRRAPKPRARARPPSHPRRRTRPATTRGVASRTGARVRR